MEGEEGEPEYEGPVEQVEVEHAEPGVEAPRCQAYVLVAEEVSQCEADLPGLDLAVVV